MGATPDIYIDINIFSAQFGDIFLLCSDGLYSMVSKEEIADTIARLPIDEAVDSLIQKTLDAGANDNVSVILVKGEMDTSSPQATV